MDVEPLIVSSGDGGGDAGMKIDSNDDATHADDVLMQQDDDDDDNGTAAAAQAGDEDEAVMQDGDNDNDAATALPVDTQSTLDGVMAVEQDDSNAPPPLVPSSGAGLSLELPPAGSIAAPAALDTVGFSSPPLVTVSREGLQTSLLGHSAQPTSGDGQSTLRHSPVITPSPEPRYTNGNGHRNNKNDNNGQDTSFSTASGLAVAPSSDLSVSPTRASFGVNDGLQQKQSRDDLDVGRALASQHQHTDDDKLSQEQTVANEGERKTTVTQRQSLEPETKGDTPARQENEVTIRQQSPDHVGGEWHTVVETNQKNQGGDVASHGGRIQQINHVKVYRRGQDTAAKTLSGGALSRPDIRKDLLAVVQLGQAAVDDSSTADDLAAAPVQLDFDEQRYALFGVVDGDDDALPLFQEDDDHNLYFDQIESLFERLRTSLPDLPARDQELELEFPDLGILLAEDSVYTRETCLYDFDRMHVGCNLPGRLRVRVTSSRGRFARDFNALASHVAESFQTSGAGAVVPLADQDEANEGGDAEGYQVEEEYVEVYDETKEEEQDGSASVAEDERVADGEDEGDAGQEEWQDNEVDFHDDNDKEETEAGDDDNDEAAEGGVYGLEDEPENLEEALAELDNEDLNAYIEGAQEDYVLSEHAQEGRDASGEVAQGSGADVGQNAKNAGDTGTDATAQLADAPARGGSAVPTASAASSSLLKPAMQLELSYDTPIGTGDEPPAVPVDQLDAVVDAAAASESASALTDVVDAAAAEPFVSVVSDTTAVEAAEINYDDEEPDDAGKPEVTEASATSKAPVDGSPGEKRGRAMAEGAEAEDGHGDAGEAEAKRARLDDAA
ncbi:hypothetical protein ACM66B_002071 [Microbotryomycetes sp. NB124-2]